MPTKILAVDDSKTIRLAIKITFAAEDAEVVAINKGTEAVARAKQMRPDIILVDHTLAEGDISGAALCQQLRADPETRAIPLIFMVPARGGVAESVAASAGADVVVGKPFDTQDLLDRVGELVKRGAGARPAVAAASGGSVSAMPTNPAPASRAAAAAVPVSNPAPTASSRTPAPVAAASPGSAAVKPAPASAATAPSAIPASAPAANSVAAANPAASREIPIVMSIPFAPANAPSAGMLERLRKAGAGAGVSPQALEALASLSAEVVERIAWEVVPELAEAILRERAQHQPPH